MSKAWSSPKTDVANVIKDGAGKETVEVEKAPEGGVWSEATHALGTTVW